MAIQDELTAILNAKYGKDVRQAIHDGIEDCYSDALASQTAIVDLVKPDKIMHCINTDPAVFTFYYSSGNYNIAMVAEKSVFGTCNGQTIAIKDSRLSGATETAGSIVFTSPLTVQASGGFNCLYVKTTYPSISPRYGIKAIANLTKDDFVVAVFYNERFEAFDNSKVFTNLDKANTWDYERTFNPFSKIATPISGKVMYDTVAYTVETSSCWLAYGRNGNTVNIGAKSVTFASGSGDHPSYLHYVYYDVANDALVAFETSGLSSLSNTTRRNDLYLLLVVYGSRLVWSSSSAENTWFVDNNDAYMAQSAFITDKTCKIFRRVGCCGDSYTSGHIVDSSDVTHGTNENYAWPHYMGTLTGNEYLNFGASGATTLSWITNQRGLPAAQAAAQNGKCDAYLIGLGINDSRIVEGQNNVALGEESDVPAPTDPDPSSWAQTYYAGIARIVRELHTLSPKAHIFIQNLPRVDTSTVGVAHYSDYNEAMRYVADLYHDTHNTHLLDLRSHMSLYNNSVLASDSRAYHYTAIGYQIMSEALALVWSEYINNHTQDFIDVAFALPDENDT